MCRLAHPRGGEMVGCPVDVWYRVGQPTMEEGGSTCFD